MLDKRKEVRPRHLEGMKALDKQIICAGGRGAVTRFACATAGGD